MSRERFTAALGALVLGTLLLGACGAPAASPTSRPTTPEPTVPIIPATTVPANRGTLEVRATDAPAAKEVTKVLITLSSVQVHRQTGETEAGWVTVVSEPKTFDLKAIAGVEEILGAATLEAGQYQQVRVEVTEAKVTVDGKEVVARVPSKTLKIVGGFTVVANETTVITLDFDAEKSVVIAGPNVNLKPVVKLLVRKGGQPASAAREVGETEEEPEATPTVETAPTATSVPPSPTGIPPSPTATATATVAPTATSPSQPATVLSDIRNATLENLNIRAGTTVTWTNRDADPHTSTSSANPRVWDSPILTIGASYSYRFTQPGTYPYYCVIHIEMTATVTVTP